MDVVSLYDYSGDALKPWASAGYKCYAYDIEHSENDHFCDGIYYKHADLHNEATVHKIIAFHKGSVKFVSAFPVCTDLALSGAPSWAKKREYDTNFQIIAAQHAMRCAHIAEAMGCKQWYIENPVGALSKLWRHWDFIFHPCDYGAYLAITDTHPEFPSHIPPRDAYRKKTCIWHGKSFQVPEKRAVVPMYVTHLSKATGTLKRSSPQAAFLGGTSKRTKRIRSATPRGWATAVFIANCGHILQS